MQKAYEAIAQATPLNLYFGTNVLFCREMGMKNLLYLRN